MQQIKIIRIFLASSIEELHEEQMVLRDYISNSVRPIFKLDGVGIEIVGYEDMYYGRIGVLTQDIIGDQINECDISLFLFKSKVGKQTVHEFEVARELQKRKQHNIFVYFFDIPEEEKRKELKNFQHRLNKEDFYWRRCKDTNELLSYFIMDLLYFERNLLGIKGSGIYKTSSSEEDMDILFAQYEQQVKDLAQLREKLHHDIDNLLQQISIVKNDEKKNISERINKIIELYKIADRQAAASDYDKEKYSNMLYEYADFLYQYGFYKESEEIFLRQFVLAEQLYGSKHENLAKSYNRIGDVYNIQDDYSKALEYYVKALTINEKVYGTNHQDTAVSCYNIATVYFNQQDYPKALEYYLKALRISEKIFGIDHPDTAAIYHKLGSVYWKQGDYDKALEYNLNALAIREKVLGNEHPDTATSYSNIGVLYRNQGNYEKALEYDLRAQAIREKVLGTNHPETAKSYNNIGVLYKTIGDYKKALKYYQKALSIQEKIYGTEHPDTAKSYTNIGGIYYLMGENYKALDYYHKALAIQEKVFGIEHLSTANLYSNIGFVYDALDDHPHALEYYNKAYQIRKKILGPENTDTKSTLEKIDNVNIVDKLKVTLLNSYHHLNMDLLREAINDLCCCVNCVECSLWFFNYNSTHSKDQEESISSISLIHRALYKGIDYQFVKATDFVQEKTQHVFGALSIEADSEKYFCRFNDVSPVIQDLISLEFVNKYKLTDFIIIPIYDEKDNKRIIAFFEISYSNIGYSDDTWKELSPIIQSFFSVAFQRFEIIQKQQLMEDLIKKHGELKDKDVESLFKSIVNDVLSHVCPFQAASLFMWDDYQNRYNLVATTGLKGVSNSNYNNVFYQKGEGITGSVGMNAKAIIADTLEKNHKSFEDLKDNAKTAMLIPICDPSNELDVVGILRIVNKTNVCNNSVIDYFNDIDVNLMLFASNYLALIIDHYQKEAIQYNFIDKLTHEIITPANAILKSAHRLYTHLEDDGFMTKHLSSYLKNIMDFAELQRWQASTNLFLSRNRKKQPFEVRYSIKPTRLYEVIQKSIDIAIPIAKKYDVPYEHIVINPKSDANLIVDIDKEAFITVFYNLFTNAIKYHDPNVQEQFYIEVSYFMGNFLVINVADNGIGIDEKDKNTIFENGFRSESAIRINATGYGIGLTVIKQIVEDFGGTISLANLRKPTVFQVIIPKNKIQYKLQ